VVVLVVGEVSRGPRLGSEACPQSQATVGRKCISASVWIQNSVNVKASLANSLVPRENRW